MSTRDSCNCPLKFRNDAGNGLEFKGWEMPCQALQHKAHVVHDVFAATFCCQKSWHNLVHVLHMTSEAL